MAIASTDLVAYAAASRPEDDASTTGGAIDPSMRVSFTQLAANDTLRAFSSSAGDTTQTLTVRGRNAQGELVECTAELNGTDLIPLSPTTTFERVIDAVLDGVCVGDVVLERVTGGTDVGIIPPGEIGFTQLFISAASESSQAVRYEKCFVKNNHGTLSLTQAVVQCTADPAGKIEVGLSATKDDTATVANRKTAPGGISFVTENTPIAVEDDVLMAGEGVGVWVKQTLDAADSPVRSSFTVQVSGISA